ncbi:MAG: hypothetical protein ACT6RN_16210 [Agrobacterium sp.]
MISLPLIAASCDVSSLRSSRICA